MLMTNNNDKKIKRAAALQYSPEHDRAPRLVASGTGEAAEKIIEKARESNVPLYEDDVLALTLNSLRIGDEIPPELYGIVAEVLVFISDMDRTYGEKHGKGK